MLGHYFISLGHPLALFPSNFSSNISKSFEPLEPLKTRPAYVSFCLL